MLLSTIEAIPRGEILVGVDEVGKGAVCYFVTAAAVIWPADYVPETPEDEKLLNLIKDSKKLSEKMREKLSKFIKENAVEYAICDVDNEEIDRINILQESQEDTNGLEELERMKSMTGDSLRNTLIRVTLNMKQ